MLRIVLFQSLIFNETEENVMQKPEGSSQQSARFQPEESLVWPIVIRYLHLEKIWIFPDEFRLSFTALQVEEHQSLWSGMAGSEETVFSNLLWGLVLRTW